MGDSIACRSATSNPAGALAAAGDGDHRPYPILPSLHHPPSLAYSMCDLFRAEVCEKFDSHSFSSVARRVQMHQGWDGQSDTHSVVGGLIPTTKSPAPIDGAAHYRFTIPIKDASSPRGRISRQVVVAVHNNKTAACPQSYRPQVEADTDSSRIHHCI